MPMMPTSRTIPRLLDELAAKHPERDALVGGGERYTYASLRDAVRAFAKGLSALRVAKGDKVAILMGNKPEWIIADLAICLIGGIMVAVNTWVTSRELQHILRHSDTTLLIASDRYLKYDYFAMLEELEPHARRCRCCGRSCMSARGDIVIRSRSRTCTRGAAMSRTP
jgi:fatty-acyl-CoA synthase